MLVELLGFEPSSWESKSQVQPVYHSSIVGIAVENWTRIAALRMLKTYHYFTATFGWHRRGESNSQNSSVKGRWLWPICLLRHKWRRTYGLLPLICNYRTIAQCFYPYRHTHLRCVWVFFVSQILAGTEWIEHPSLVLETKIIPLYDVPIEKLKLDVRRHELNLYI